LKQQSKTFKLPAGGTKSTGASPSPSNPVDATETRRLAEEITDPVVFFTGFILMLFILAAIYLLERRVDRRKRDALLRHRREIPHY